MRYNSDLKDLFNFVHTSPFVSQNIPIQRYVTHQSTTGDSSANEVTLPVPKEYYNGKVFVFIAMFF